MARLTLRHAKLVPPYAPLIAASRIEKIPRQICRECRRLLAKSGQLPASLTRHDVNDTQYCFICSSDARRKCSTAHIEALPVCFNGNIHDWPFKKGLDRPPHQSVTWILQQGLFQMHLLL